MKIADAFEQLIQGPLPLRFTAYDGSASGPEEAPFGMDLKNERGLAYLMTAPGDLGLGRAYVSGDLVVTGVHPGDPYEGLKALQKGLKLRVPDAPLYIMYPKVVGANATPIAFAEVYLALQNKTVDAQENPLPTILAKKFYEVQTHINLTGHITEMLITIVGGHVWSKLSDADRKTFEAVFKEAAEKSNAEILKSEQALVGEFATKYGKTVVKSDREAFKKVFTPFLVGKDVPWDKVLYDRVQAIK